ncbi:MAG: hypothetical protein U5R30_02625 [Deltaproteobacteria bacterium]|jgi:hypothetical protein|nr:hypothetical protein [Deltaproteobacteria bacterium]
MRTQLLFFAAVGFFILGCKAQDAALYFFLATHFLTLSICLYFYTRENSITAQTAAGDESD